MEKQSQVQQEQTKASTSQQPQQRTRSRAPEQEPSPFPLFAFSAIPFTAPPPIIQTKATVVGASGDAFEQEADRVAEQVTAGSSAPPLHHSPTSTVQRDAQGGQSPALSPSFQSSLSSSLGGGAALPAALREQFEPRFGADFSGVRIHTGAQAEQLNSSIQSRAFTTGQDIFFGEGEYRPSTQQGQKILAHELTHVGQQNPGIMHTPLLRDSGKAIRPLRLNPKDNKYYSSATYGLFADYKADSAEDAFLTATSGDGLRGGHTTIYLEYFDANDLPLSYRIDLFTAANDGIKIRQKLMPSGEMEDTIANKGVGKRKTWKVTRQAAAKAKAKADDVESKVDEYTYGLLGKKPSSKKVLNCTRFGQAVLKEAGIPIHIGWFKAPDLITRASTTDKSIQSVPTLADLAITTTSEMPADCRKASSFLSAAHANNTTVGIGSLSAIGQNIELYHRLQETALRAAPFISAIKETRKFVRSAAIDEYVSTRGSTDPYAHVATLQFIRGDFYTKLKLEAARFLAEIEADRQKMEDTGGDEAPYTELPPKINDALLSLKDLMDYADSTALVKGKVREHMEADALRGGSQFNDRQYKNILAQGEFAAFDARMD